MTSAHAHALRECAKRNGHEHCVTQAFLESSYKEPYRGLLKCRIEETLSKTLHLFSIATAITLAMLTIDTVLLIVVVIRQSERIELSRQHTEHRCIFLCTYDTEPARQLTKELHLLGICDDIIYSSLFLLKILYCCTRTLRFVAGGEFFLPYASSQVVAQYNTSPVQVLECVYKAEEWSNPCVLCSTEGICNDEVGSLDLLTSVTIVIAR